MIKFTFTLENFVSSIVIVNLLFSYIIYFFHVKFCFFQFFARDLKILLSARAPFAGRETATGVLALTGRGCVTSAPAAVVSKIRAK